MRTKLLRLITIGPCYLLALLFVACARTPDHIPELTPTTLPGTTQRPVIRNSEPSRVPDSKVPSTDVSVTDLQSFQDASMGVQFSFPSDWETLPRDPNAPSGVALHSPPVGDNPEPIIFTLVVESRPDSDISVHTSVDREIALLSQAAKKRVARKRISVGGEEAELVTGLPSEGGAAETFVIHNGQLFHFVLQPYDRSNSSLAPFLPKMKAIYDDLLQSVKFLE